jgi:hypothetical protein
MSHKPQSATTLPALPRSILPSRSPFFQLMPARGERLGVLIVFFSFSHLKFSKKSAFYAFLPLKSPHFAPLDTLTNEPKLRIYSLNDLGKIHAKDQSDL